MRKYYRVMLGARSIHAQLCRSDGFIGADYGIHGDLSADLNDGWRAFNEKFRPIYLESHPEKNMIGAGLACGALWTVARGIQVGDIVICPSGDGYYYVDEVTGGYHHAPGHPLPHRRTVNWLAQTIAREEMSESFKRAAGSIGTISTVTPYGPEIEKFLGPMNAVAAVAAIADVEDAAAFAMEKHLEEFLVRNWANTELGKEYEIYSEDGDVVGQQYPTDTGPMDILAVKKDKSELLVVELKKGKASDAVVGQVEPPRLSWRLVGLSQASAMES